MFELIASIGMKAVLELIDEATSEHNYVDTNLVKHLVSGKIQEQQSELVPYVTRDEFICPCCQKNKQNEDTVALLNLARNKAGIAFVISSGYRCRKYNEKIGGEEKSSHTFGFAADIRVKNGWDKFKILENCMNVGFNRFGIYDHHIHVDNDPSKPKNVVWSGISR